MKRILRTNKLESDLHVPSETKDVVDFLHFIFVFDLQKLISRFARSELVSWLAQGVSPLVSQLSLQYYCTLMFLLTNFFKIPFLITSKNHSDVHAFLVY